uniref:hypothetical protein n=1 Tax=Thaumasiovibrio occultus TaxID=1891184 RepID=UPI000B34F4B9|nr:hypothetical protein [Thaumasiovibrio occultus]
MMRKQKGMMSLTISAIILVAALLMSLGSSRSVFYQIKRSHNEILAKQAHWAAEGGLECAITRSFLDADSSLVSDPSYLASDCVNPLGLDSITFTNEFDEIYTIRSSYSSARTATALNRQINFAAKADRAPGAIKTSSDLLVRGSVTVEPPHPGEKLGEIPGVVPKAHYWECVFLRYKNQVRFMAGTTMDNKAFTGALPGGPYGVTGGPYEILKNKDECASSHKTVDLTDLKADVKEDTDISPFEDLFGRPASEWLQVKTSTDPDTKFEQVISTSPSDCGTKVLGAMASNERIWVTGPCDLSTSDFSTVATNSDSMPHGILLVVQNGAVGLYGSLTIKGVLLQFNNSYTPTPSQWNGFDTNLVASLDLEYEADVIAMYPGETTKHDPELATYIQQGALKFTGGQYFDTNGELGIYKSAMNFAYNDDIIDGLYPIKGMGLVEGTWHDF